MPSADQRYSDALVRMRSPGHTETSCKGPASHQETTGLLLTSTWAGTSQRPVKAKPQSLGKTKLDLPLPGTVLGCSFQLHMFRATETPPAYLAYTRDAGTFAL